MAAPITPLDVLENRRNDMKTKMELLICRIQAEFCKILENEEESDKKFLVDKWARKEGGGGITCIIQVF